MEILRENTIEKDDDAFVTTEDLLSIRIYQQILVLLKCFRFFFSLGYVGVASTVTVFPISKILVYPKD